MPSVMTDTSGAGHLREQSLEYHVGLHCAHWQRGVNVLQLGVFCFVIASAPHSPLSHVLIDLSQIKPVLAEHDEEPQMQVALLGAVPSVLVQSGAVRQRQVLEEEHD